MKISTIMDRLNKIMAKEGDVHVKFISKYMPDKGEYYIVPTKNKEKYGD